MVEYDEINPDEPSPIGVQRFRRSQVQAIIMVLASVHVGADLKRCSNVNRICKVLMLACMCDGAYCAREASKVLGIDEDVIKAEVESERLALRAMLEAKDFDRAQLGEVVYHLTHLLSHLDSEHIDAYNSVTLRALGDESDMGTRRAAELLDISDITYRSKAGRIKRRVLHKLRRIYENGNA